MADFTLEAEHGATGQRGARLVIGLDEAGRGPWAGPVVAAAVWLDPERCPRALSERLDDCKTLAPALRDELHDLVLACAGCGIAAVGLGEASVGEIDEINILEASLRAMARAAADLEAKTGRAPRAALVDGNKSPALACRARPIVGGDRLSLSIAAASIVAKVTRDRLMDDLAQRHPGYGWERNRGYGTPEHRAALRRLGATAQHRRSFRPVQEVLAFP